MYKNFFGLSCLPFEDRIQPEFLFTHPELDEVLASMECEIRYRQGLGLVVGEAGTGKTLLVRSLMTKLGTQEPAVIIRCPADGRLDVVREACKGFDVTLPSQYNAKRGLARLRRRLLDAQGQGRFPVLILDQSENLSVESVQALESLIDLSRDDKRLLTILLVGQPRVTDMLGQPRFDRLRQQLSTEIRVHKFNFVQTQAYITHRLGIAGAGTKPIFDDAALAVIHIITQGIARLINRLADAGMVAAYSAGQSCVTAELVREMSANQAEKSLSNHSKITVDQEDAQMSKLVSRVDSTIQAMKGEDIYVATSSQVNDGTMNISDRARTLISKLEQTLRQSEQGTAKLEYRAKSIVAEVQDQLRELENETMRVGGVATEVQPQLERIEKTCDRAVKVEAELSAMAETLVERADSVQQRISLLLTAMTDADVCRENIRTTTHQATDIVEQTQQTSQTIQASLDQVRKELKEVQIASQDAVENVRKQIGHVGEDAQRSYKTLVKKERNMLDDCFRNVIKESIVAFKNNLSQITEKMLDEERKIAQDAIKDHRQLAKKELEDRQRLAKKELEDQQQLVKKELEDQQQLFERMKEKSLTDFQKQLDLKHQHSINVIEKTSHMKENTFRVAMTAMAKDITDTIDSQTVQNRHEVDQLQSRVATVLQTSSKELEQLTQEHAKTWESFAINSVTHRDELESLNAKSRGLATQFNDLSSMAKTTENIVQQAKVSVHDMQRVSQSAQIELTSAMDQAKSITGDVTNACGQVESLQRSISNTLLEVGSAYERLHTLSEKAIHVEKISSKFENIEGLVDQAHKAVEVLQPAVSAADEKAGRLQSHHAAVTSLLTKLTQANVEGQSVVHRVEKASQSAQHLAEKTTIKIDRMIQDVWDLTAKAESASKELTSTHERVQKEGQQVIKGETVVAPSEPDENAQATQQEDDITLRSEAYEKLTQQVNSIAKVLSKAQDVAKSTREELVEAKETYSNLTEISGTANQQIVSLDTLIKSAHGMIETHEQLQLETTTSTQELQQHLAAMADTTDAGMQMINEFTKQTIDIEKQLRTATRKSAQLQANVAEALAQPGEIVAGAKEQATQLEHVCTAVRKVFSALSQTSLEAQEKIKLFNQSKTQAQTEFEKLKQSTSQAAEGIRSLGQTNIKQIKNLASQASEGIQSLTKSGLDNLRGAAKRTVDNVRAESSRASESLSEWVQETKRAQQRLEHTLQFVPPISQTHPINSAAPLSGLSTTVDYDVTDAASNHDHRLLVEKQVGVEEISMQGDNQATRKAKIKKLLEEAREATASARG